ncbi:SOS response-associated peptidase family protein [Microbacterium sp. 22303]|uniref:SOS response-associated peptidase family protein n=1 Tax=Microbacterium sp. 22303 TaxID=3453905 RepID=UPI003F85B265
MPSINSRSETLETRFKARPLPARAIVPASYWREMQKPSKRWVHLALPGEELIGMAAVLQRGRAEDGTEYTCYSLVMQEAAAHIADVHDRMPVLVPQDFAGEWLTSEAPAVELIDAARAAAFPLAERVIARPQGSASTSAPSLFQTAPPGGRETGSQDEPGGSGPGSQPRV